MGKLADESDRVGDPGALPLAEVHLAGDAAEDVGPVTPGTLAGLP